MCSFQDIPLHLRSQHAVGFGRAITCGTSTSIGSATSVTLRQHQPHTPSVHLGIHLHSTQSPDVQCLRGTFPPTYLLSSSDANRPPPQFLSLQHALVLVFGPSIEYLWKSGGTINIIRVPRLHSSARPLNHSHSPENGKTRLTNNSACADTVVRDL